MPDGRVILSSHIFQEVLSLWLFCHQYLVHFWWSSLSCACPLPKAVGGERVVSGSNSKIFDLHNQSSPEQGTDDLQR
ncbi:hypothetical protein BDR07DRAFT_32167 [Suillus spraguei]|nr:hypothetical protein BDR07DRAFT_32167 [Suillus spraguei]